MITEKNNTSNNWVCPHCKEKGSFAIVEDAILQDSFRELLCECNECEELFIRRYKYVEMIKLNREVVNPAD